MKAPRVNFEKAASHLLGELDLSLGSAYVRQSSVEGVRVLVLELEAGTKPRRAPKEVDGYPVIYKIRRVEKTQN